MNQQGDLPRDLAHPRGRLASLIANIVVGVALLVILGGVIAFGILASTWAS